MEAKEGEKRVREREGGEWEGGGEGRRGIQRRFSPFTLNSAMIP